MEEILLLRQRRKTKLETISTLRFDIATKHELIQTLERQINEIDMEIEKICISPSYQKELRMTVCQKPLL